jgi:hypothetical protein
MWAIVKARLVYINSSSTNNFASPVQIPIIWGDRGERNVDMRDKERRKTERERDILRLRERQGETLRSRETHRDVDIKRERQRDTETQT